MRLAAPLFFGAVLFGIRPPFRRQLFAVDDIFFYGHFTVGETYFGSVSDSDGGTLSERSNNTVCFSHECAKWMRKLGCLVNASPKLRVRPRPF